MKYVHLLRTCAYTHTLTHSGVLACVLDIEKTSVRDKARESVCIRVIKRE